MGKALTNTLSEPISDIFTAEIKAHSGVQKTRTKTILQRIANSDRKAFGECVELYGNYVWTLAGKCCENAEERERIVAEIFQDVWENAGHFDARRTDEKKFIAILSLRRLLNRTSKQENL